jgi:hypothetical protein
MKNISLIALSLLFPCLAFAQSPDPVHKPYLGMVEIGFLYGVKKEGEFKTPTAAPTVQMFNGYQIDELLAVGATVGIDIYEHSIVTPLALGIRGQLVNSRVSPFYSFDAGYAPALLSDESHSSVQQKNKGGWMFNPALGIRVKTGHDTAFTFGAGYKSQKTETESSWHLARTEQKVHYKRMTMRMGFMF